MTIKTALTALTLSLIPALGMANGCDYDKQAQSCAEGMTWDAQSQSCVKQVTG